MVTLTRDAYHVYVTWKPVSSADSYDVSWESADKTISDIASVLSTEGCTYTIMCPASQKLSVKVSAYSDVTAYSADSKAVVITAWTMKAPAKPTLKQIGKNMLVSWKTVDHADRYVVQIYNKDRSYQRRTIVGADKLTWTLENAPVGELLYVTIVVECDVLADQKTSVAASLKIVSKAIPEEDAMVYIP